MLAADARRPPVRRSLPVQLYSYAVSPYDDWHTKAWGSSLVLIVVIAGLSLATRLVARGGTVNR